jgi:uncharacterized lipoprotein YddW (UPF0748 family)
MGACSIPSLTVLALVLLALSPARAAEAPEVRALWVIRTALVTPESADQMVDAAAEAGINTLLVQVRGRGDAFYSSALLPRSDLLASAQADYDPLARVLERARARGLSVHAWINVLLSANYGQKLEPAHELARHPEWVMVPRACAAEALRSGPRGLRAIVWRAAKDSDAEGYYLSPAAPGVAEHLEAVVKELLERYAVDGLHLDFIRLPGPDYDYSPAALRAFAPGRSPRALLAGPTLDAPAWSEWRRESVTRIVERLAKTARATRKDAVVSAAVVSDRATAVEHKSQDWPGWLEAGLLDVVCPMAYTTDDRIFRRQAEDARAAAGAGRGVWVGIGAFRLSLDGILAKVRLARETGANGFVLFSHESLPRADRARLRAAVQESRAPRRAPDAASPAAAAAAVP